MLCAVAGSPVGGIVIAGAANPATYTFANITFRPFGPLTTGMTQQIGDKLGTNPHVRAASSVFYVGFSQRYRLTITDGDSFMHRRIVFRSSRRFLQGNLPFTGLVGGQGIMIPLDQYAIPAGPTTDAIIEDIFAGSKGSDWDDTMLASIDRRRIKLISDKKYTYNSPNDIGVTRCFKIWTPLRFSFDYDEDESGQAIINNDDPAVSASTYGFGSPWNTLRSIGNVYVIDIFASANGVGNVGYSKETALYWHER
jgi:hypothetical protein